jgi:FMN reductase
VVTGRPVEHVVTKEETTLELYERAKLYFDAQDFMVAARMLADVVGQEPAELAPRLLMARAYYHSAQLRRAEAELRLIIERHPTEDYAYLVLGRTLQRQRRHQEAAGYLRIAAAYAGDPASAA